jgi:dihydrofolate reductase
MGLLTFTINLTLDGCVDHNEGIADDETRVFFTHLVDESGAMLWGRVTYEMMESYWPALARGEAQAPPAMRVWAVKLTAKPKYVVSSTRKGLPWNNSHHVAGDMRTGVPKLKDATPRGVLLGRGKLAAELDRRELIDEYRLLLALLLERSGPRGAVQFPRHRRRRAASKAVVDLQFLACHQLTSHLEFSARRLRLLRVPVQAALDEAASWTADGRSRERGGNAAAALAILCRSDMGRWPVVATPRPP